MPEVAPAILHSALAADVLFANKRTGAMYAAEYFKKNVWYPTSYYPNPHFKTVNKKGFARVPTLQAACLKVLSTYHKAFGNHQGRPFVRSHLDKLHDNHKHANMILAAADRETVEVTPLQAQALEYTDEAIMRMNRAMGTTDQVGKTPLQLYTGCLNKIPLGSAAGLYPSVVVRGVRGHTKHTISPCGQKLETFPQLIQHFFGMVDRRERFQVTWAVSPKSAMEISMEEQATDETFEAWCAKHRLFIIPSAPFIFAERLVLYYSKLVEQNTDIKIGFKWPRGGADFLFKGFNLREAFFLVTVIFRSWTRLFIRY